ncbi:MAG: thiamine biosynthesis lipoprotein [Planctomycetota bacterium]
MQKLAIHAMGTRFELVLADDLSPALLRAAGEAALAEIEDAHQRLSAFAKDSVIAHLNRAASLGPDAGPIPIDGETHELLVRCAELVKLTDGAFDPGLGQRMQQLGFRDGAASDAPFGGGWRGAVEVNPSAPQVHFLRAGVAIDLGGVAKGYALDLAAQALREAGVQRALLHGGTSTVLALDPPPRQDAWRVALGPEQDAPIAHLANAAFSLSDLGGRTAGSADAPESHVLDPRTGHSARGARRAAIAVPLAHGDALAADAYSTAALVAGQDLALPNQVELLTLGFTKSERHHAIPAGADPIIRLATPASKTSAQQRCTVPTDVPY